MPRPPLLPKKEADPETVTTSIRVKRTRLNDIDEIAAAEGFSRNALIVQALDRYVADYKDAKKTGR